MISLFSRTIYFINYLIQHWWLYQLLLLIRRRALRSKLASYYFFKHLFFLKKRVLFQHIIHIILRVIRFKFHSLFFHIYIRNLWSRILRQFKDIHICLQKLCFHIWSYRLVSGSILSIRRWLSTIGIHLIFVILMIW